MARGLPLGLTPAGGGRGATRLPELRRAARSDSWGLSYMEQVTHPGTAPREYRLRIIHLTPNYSLEENLLGAVAS